MTENLGEAMLSAARETAAERRYYAGCRDALKRFAWWKDGVEYVGSTGYTLAQALADVDEAEREHRSYAVEGL